jgi:hypothetical protein
MGIFASIVGSLPVVRGFCQIWETPDSITRPVNNFGPSPVLWGAPDSIVGPLTTASHPKTLPVLWTIASKAGSLAVLLVPSSIAGWCQYFWAKTCHNFWALASILGTLASIVWETVMFLDSSQYCLGCVSFVGPCQYCGHSWQYYGATGRIVRSV